MTFTRALRLVSIWPRPETSNRRKSGGSRTPAALQLSVFGKSRYMSANTIPLREQVRDCVEFVRTTWEEIERKIQEEEP